MSEFLGNTPPQKQHYPLYNDTDSAYLSVAALQELDFTFDVDQKQEELVFTYKVLRSELEASKKDFSNSPEPFVCIEIGPQFGFDALLSAYAKHSAPAVVDKRAWSVRPAQELNRRSVIDTPEVAIKKPFFKVLAMLKDANNGLDDGGLYFTDTYLTKQKAHAQDQILLNPADQIMLNTQRRLQGLPLLSSQGSNRFIQTKVRNIAGITGCLSAYAAQDILKLGYSNVKALQDSGVRIAVGIKKFPQHIMYG